MNKVLKKISKLIKNTEFEHKTYVVGGYVRDYLLGRKFNNDLDIVVNLPDGGIKLANYLYHQGISSEPIIYNNFGTALIKIGSWEIEFVMTRKESYRRKSRKPEVDFATLEEDINRRDFTINSLLLDLSNQEILDLSKKGRKDLKTGLIRTVSDPELVFKEDPLRMLRAVRFARQLNFRIENNTAANIKKNYSRLQVISQERIKEEFSKIILTKKPSQGIRLLKNLQLLYQFIPEFEEIESVTQNRYHDKDVFEHTMQVLDNTTDNIVLRLAALLHDIGKKRTKTIDEDGKIHFYKHEFIGAELSKKILKRLKYSKNTVNRVKFLIRNHLRTKNYGSDAKVPKDSTIRRFIKEMGNNLELVLALIDADNKSHKENYELKNQVKFLRKRIKEINRTFQKKDLPVDGNDIMQSFNLSEGKKVGELLQEAETIWLENPELGKKEILAELKTKHRV